MSTEAVVVRPAPVAQVELRLRALLVTGAPLLVGIVVTLPLVLLLANSLNVAAPGRELTYGLDNWVRAFSDPITLNALWNTFALGAVRTAISLPLALALTWLIARSDLPGRTLLELLCWIGIFLPHLPMTFGWILLLDPQFGLVNEALKRLPFVEGSVFNIYSFWGIIWVHLASTSIYYKVVLLLPAFRRVGAVLEEAARVCGANQLTTTLRVTIPVLAPAVLAVTVLAFVRSLEVFEVELLLGRPANIPVYSTRIYDLVRDQPPQFGQATALGVIFLVVLISLAIFYQWYLRGRSFATVTGHGYSAAPVRLGRWRWPVAAACFAFFAVALAAPMVFLLLGSFMRRYGFFHIRDPYTLSHWQNLFNDPIFLLSVRNSLIIATGVALLGVLLYSLVAYSIVRGRSRLTRVTDILMWVPWAVPGILLSLGLLWLFLSTPLRGLLYGTTLGIILALVIKDSPLSTQFFKAGLLQIGAELEESARVCGASWFRTYWRVLFPLLAPTAITVGLLSFLSAIRDISISVLLYSPQSRPLSILMLEYSFSGEMERGTAIGVLVTVFVLLVTLIARALGFRLARERT
ncbi:MAG TPA: iron ABC transporter permease [Chloroflexota bacterium]|nr:iron ABC transporter permease [Chloroflexota bacterium]